jgi:hypothetical protein
MPEREQESNVDFLVSTVCALSLFLTEQEESGQGLLGCDVV